MQSAVSVDDKEITMDKIDGARAFMEVVSGKVVRMWKYKRMFTPLEQEKKWPDQSEFIDDICDYVFITGIFEVFGKVLIRSCPVDLADFDEDGNLVGCKYGEYDYLDDIHIAVNERDTERLKEGDL
jgi:hypothetical protein|nr:MAG TPA_asm: hypothetical protein [Caudoviricetes sp.]